MSNHLQSEIKQTQPFRSHQQELILTLLRTSALVRNQIDHALNHTNLSAQQYNVLRILRGAKEALPTMEISNRLVEPTPGITRLITKLEHAGTLKRKQCKNDKRIFYCEITQKGLKLLTELDPIIKDLNDQLFKALPDAQIKTLIENLNQLRQALPAIAKLNGAWSDK